LAQDLCSAHSFFVLICWLGLANSRSGRRQKVGGKRSRDISSPSFPPYWDNFSEVVLSLVKTIPPDRYLLYIDSIRFSGAQNHCSTLGPFRVEDIETFPCH
jgi:hypothetical protein